MNASRGPRSDCPLLLPAAPTSLGAAHARREAALPLNDLQRDIVRAFDALERRRSVETDAGTSDGAHRVAAAAAAGAALPTLQGEASEWIAALLRRIGIRGDIDDA